MAMLDWKRPTLADIELIRAHIGDLSLYGSDASPANIFLLRNKYNIEIAFSDNMFFRRYNGKDSRCGYAFPLGSVDLRKAIDLLKNDSEKRGLPLRFCLLSKEQKEAIENISSDFKFTINENDSDYIYKRSNLASLKPNKFQKKRNHISSFLRKYESYQLREISSENYQDAIYVNELWHKEHCLEWSYECDSIAEAIANFQQLHLKGVVLYIDDAPIAMSIGSEVSHNVFVTHFEKAITDAAKNGAYTLINRDFAALLSEYEYINREEDMGVEGLRKAKRSYFPDMMGEKYWGE